MKVRNVDTVALGSVTLDTVRKRVVIVCRVSATET